MNAITEIELSSLHREEVARQANNNRLARQLRANRRGAAARFGNALPGRIFGWFPRKGQTAQC